MKGGEIESFTTVRLRRRHTKHFGAAGDASCFHLGLSRSQDENWGCAGAAGMGAWLGWFAPWWEICGASDGAWTQFLKADLSKLLQKAFAARDLLSPLFEGTGFRTSLLCSSCTCSAGPPLVLLRP